MIIKEITIKNFRSIKDVTIPLRNYGEGINESKTTFLVGINESGKSAILDAISLINKGMSDVDYDNDCQLEAHEDQNYIDIYASLELSSNDTWKKNIAEKVKLSNDFIKQLEIIELVKNVYTDKDGADQQYDITVNDGLPLYRYIINTEKKTVGTLVQNIETVEFLSEFNKIEMEITKNNAESFLLSNQKILTKEKLESILSNNLESLFDSLMPTIQIWKPSPEYLINNVVNLDEFKENTNLSIPLKNIFRIYGKTTDEEIKSTIERALSNQARCDELQEKMSDKVTKYINHIWQEHKIKLRISINSNNCQVHVEDKDKKFAYYSMSQRSDGFKQFISLILSLSALNESKTLKNNIILIDEPEVHLHPSGVRYMRDEILRIGKTNNVIVSTHSHYMVDTDTPERHWIVQKEKSQTRITQVNESLNLSDDKVIAAAFGLNIFKELLPQHIIIVEGADDKEILSQAIHLLHNSFFHSIKPAGGASKTSGFARLFNEEKIPAFIVLDSDKEGRDAKKFIIDNQSDNYSNSNVFTLKDLLITLPSDSTIEDLLPLDFVKSFFDSEIEKDFILESDKAIINQLKNQDKDLKTNKQKLDSLKLKLAKEFCVKYNTPEKMREVTRIVTLVNSLILKIGEFNQ